MDQFEDASRQERKNMIWTPEMDKCLIEILVIQCNEGMKVEKGFKAHAYVAAANALRQSFNIVINKDHVINRMKTIKKGFRDIELMLSRSGITFNSTTKQVQCTDAVWEDTVQAHPQLKNLRYKRIEMLNELTIVCGNDAATGEWCRGGPDINGKRTTRESQKQALNESNEDTECENVEENDVQEVVNQVNKKRRQSQIKTEGNSSEKPHGRANNYKYFVQTMKVVANSIDKMAESIEKKRSIIDPGMLLGCLRQIDGIHEDDIFYVFENFLEHEVKANAFLVYPPDMRIRYLKKEFKIIINEPIVCDNGDDFYNLL